jgi:hypothetical protein
MTVFSDLSNFSPILSTSPPIFCFAGRMTSATPWFSSFVFSLKRVQLVLVYSLSFSSFRPCSFSLAASLSCLDGLATRVFSAPKNPPILYVRLLRFTVELMGKASFIFLPQSWIRSSCNFLPAPYQSTTFTEASWSLYSITSNCSEPRGKTTAIWAFSLLMKYAWVYLYLILMTSSPTAIVSPYPSVRHTLSPFCTNDHFSA